MTIDEIADKLGFKTEEILNVYPYGSKIYGTATKDSDTDYIVVFKSAFLSNGAFKNNAISSEDRSVQAICYSRTGFIDAINNYEIGVLECLFLPEDRIVQKKWSFKLEKINNKTLAKKIIHKASMSWHSAKRAKANNQINKAKKGIFHALRILDFGLQIKNKGKIYDYSSCNDLCNNIMNDTNFKTRKYIPMRDKLMKQLKEKC